MNRVFVHGWSYDATFWNPLRASLRSATDGADDHLVEHGYLGTMPGQTLPDAPFVGVTHSAGLLWLLGQDLGRCRGIVAINGFACFCSRPGFDAGVPPRLLARMKQSLRMDAGATLAAFRQRIGDTAPAAGPPHAERLAAGLEQLETADRRAALGDFDRPLLLIGGSRDPLVSADMAPRGAAAEHWLDDGHLLPLTRPEPLAHYLRDFEKGLAA